MANTKKIDCVILGLLSHESLTGYEIKRRMDSSLHLFWGASFGSIYPTLNCLMKEGKILAQDVSENGREKIMYTITESGREHLKQWLLLPVEKDEIRYETLLKLFFGSENSSESTRKHIEEFEKKIEKELEELKKSVKRLEVLQDTEEAHIYYLLTAKFGVQTYEVYLNWCKEAKNEIRKREK